MGTLEPRWHPHVEEAYREGLFHGVELVNGKDFYPAVYPWITEKHLAILCNSDLHLPTPPRAVGGPRPITLVFARTADAEGVREALVARRTAAWLGDDVWGAEEHLRGLWQGALPPFPSALSARPGQRLLLRIQNASAIPFRLRPRPGPAWVRLEAVTVEAAGDLARLPAHRARRARRPAAVALRSRGHEPAHRTRPRARGHPPPRNHGRALARTIHEVRLALLHE